MNQAELRKVRDALKRLINAHSIAESDCAYNQLEQDAAHADALEAFAVLEAAAQRHG